MKKQNFFTKQFLDRNYYIQPLLKSGANISEIQDFVRKQAEIDRQYMKVAYEVAMHQSPDLSTQNGAILVTDNSSFSLDNIVSRGANRIDCRVGYNSQRMSRPDKYLFTEHAERNSVLNAAKKGVKTEGLIMYVPWFACADCGRAIIGAGIKEVIGYAGPERWSREQAQRDGKAMDWTKSIATAIEMFDSVGIKYRWIDGKIDPTNHIKVRFGGEYVNP